jgi:hypothetical protein
MKQDNANRRIPVSHTQVAPWGFEPGSLVTGSKWVSTGPVRHSENEVRLQALYRAPPPPAADSVGYEAGRETCSERETRTGKLCEIKWDYHIVSMRA